MSFDDRAGCPPGWVRDQWMREVPKNPVDGEFLDGALPCDLPIAGYWAVGALLIFSRLVLGAANLYVLKTVHRARGKNARQKRRGLAPFFDILCTVVVILFVCLAPVTSSRNGVTWVLFGLSYTPYFIGSYLFIVKMVRNRLRIVGTGKSGVSSMPRSNARVREERRTLFLLIFSIVGIVGAPITWIVGAAAFGGSVVAHRVGIALFCLTTSTMQILAFTESIRTAIRLSKHLDASPPLGPGPKVNPMKVLLFRLVRSALTFVPVWIASTALLIALASGALAFHWYIAYILLFMPVINAAAAVSMFLRKSTRQESESSKGSKMAKMKSAANAVEDILNIPTVMHETDHAVGPVVPLPQQGSFTESKLVSGYQNET